MTTEAAEAPGATPEPEPAPTPAPTPAPAPAAEPKTRAASRWASRMLLWGSIVLLVLLVSLLVNYLSFRHYTRWDWTSAGMFTLSSRTEQTLRELHSAVNIYVFMSESEPNYTEVHELLERYRAKSGRIHVRYVDPDREPAQFRSLSQRFGLAAAALESGETVVDVAAVVVAGSRHWRITRDDLVSVDMDSLEENEGQQSRVDVKAEQALTGALVQVTHGRATKVCLSKGHGEWSLEESGERSIGGLKDTLRRDNIELEEFETRGVRSVPRQCDAVFVLGPLRAFGPEEAQLLGSYVRSGGRVLLAVDPVLERGAIQPTGLETMARELGIRIDQDIVFENDPQRRSPQGFFVATDFGDHPTMRALRAAGGPAAFVVPRSLGIVDETRATALVKASNDSFGETNVADLEQGQDPRKDGADVAGPVTLAAAVDLGAHGEGEGEGGASRSRQRRGRLVVVGESRWLAAELLDDPRFVNFDLLSAWTGWLTERAALISIAPKRMKLRAVTMTEDDLTGLLFRVLVLMPAAVLLLGVAMWWTRRS